ncbi:hypothetical protein L6R50_25640 [Myxococcota bacterium]|nr:hypothetical protein [Myxococcota bacterium]
MIPGDTDPKAWAAHVECFRRMSPEQRVRIALDLSVRLRETMKEGIRTRHPDYTDEEAHHAMLRLLLGHDLYHRAYPGRPPLAA